MEPTQPQDQLERQVDMDLNTLAFLATANLPLDLVDNPAFHRFVKYLNPNAHVMTQILSAIKMVLLLYNNLKNEYDKYLSEELPDLQTVGLTTDVWRSSSNEDYLALNLHFVDDSWVLQRFNVESRNLKECHSEAGMAEMIHNMIKKIPGLQADTKKIMTTHTGSNMQKACEESSVVDTTLVCMENILNKVLRASFIIPDVDDLIKSCKELASAAHQSIISVRIRQKCQELNGKKIESL